MEKKLGVYICTGCGIGEAVDAEALSKLAAEEHKAPVCRSHEFLCSEEGLALIRKDVEEGTNALVIAACSMRAMTDAFRFDPMKTIAIRVNLREHVAWCQEPKGEDTQMLAEDYLRMGIARAEKTELLEPFKEEIEKAVLVVGGGRTGLTAALGAAEAGSEVVLVEKEKELGGWMTKWHRQLPTSPPYAEAEDLDIGALVSAVQGNSRVKVHTSTKIEKISGAPGMFDVSLKNGEGSTTVRVGAIVQATGWRPYDASRLEHLGRGKHKNVVTSVEFEEMARTGKIARPSDGRPAESVAFIQCAGSRDEKHLPYCSSVCCRVSLKQATYVRSANPEAKAYILYKDLRSPGEHEEFYRARQDDARIFLARGEVTGVEPAGGNELLVEMENSILGEKVKIRADLVVLAVGMVPNAADGEAVRKLEDSKAMVAKGEAAGEETGQIEEAKKAIAELRAKHEGTEILNLTYRQGPDAPALTHGFPDSHFICFPYETRRTGSYAAGCVREPMDSSSSAEDAAGAALKAIQCVELASRGAAVHPRAGDISYPDFDLPRCTQCKRCTEECPFGVLDEDVKFTPKPNPTRCRRCGICLGSCPERIINFNDYSVDLIGSMIKSVNVPDEFDEKPRLLGFVCENDVYPALDAAGLKRMRYSPFIRFIPVRCLGAVNVVWISDALACGFDGIILIGCKSGDDYQCHFIKGSELARYRGDNVREKLKQMVLEDERVRIEEIALADFDKLPGIIDEFAAKIEELGMNPFKGL